MRLTFDGRPDTGVGVSLEFQLLDPATFQPVPAAPALLEHLQDAYSFQPSLYRSVVTVETQLHTSHHALAAQMHERFSRLAEVAASRHVLVMASGTHPTADWRDLQITASPRFEAFVRRLQWVGRRAAVYGMRIRVGVPDGEKAVVLCNSISSLVPVLIALSASSPYWRSVDTGLASCRTRVIDSIPNAGLPPNLMNFAEFQAYVKTLRAAESIESVSDIWWDVRPNLASGTVELQVCDMPQTLREAVAISAFARALVIWLLERYDAGEPIPLSESWINRENRWRATRFGLDAELVHSPSDALISARDRLQELCGELAGVVAREKLEPQFQVLQEICAQGSGTVRQRRLCAAHGREEVPGYLVQELLTDQPLY